MKAKKIVIVKRLHLNNRTDRKNPQDFLGKNYCLGNRAAIQEHKQYIQKGLRQKDAKTKLI